MDNNAKSLAYLCWVDCLERFDVLLEELRAIQINLAYQLRAEPIQVALMYEELLLSSHSEMIYSLVSKHSAGVVADVFIPKFPTPEVLKKFPSVHLKKRAGKWMDKTLKSILSQGDDHKREKWQRSSLYTKLQNECVKHKSKFSSNSQFDFVNTQDNSILERLYDRSSLGEQVTLGMTAGLYKLWETSFWGLDQRQLYYSLQASQQLKVNILRDRLVFFKKGFEAFTQSSIEDGLLYELLTVRRICLLRAKGYIERVRDHQQAVSASVDHAVHDNPRPLTTRRRDQTYYSRVLNDMCADVFSDMYSLLSSCEEKVENVKNGFSVNHQWGHQYTSEYNRLLNSEYKTCHAYVKTAYWTPDRPDLQSAIVHEVGHVFVDVVFDNLSNSYLSNETTSFQKLLLELKEVLGSFLLDGQANTVESVLQEMAVDLLAASVKGPSYLYALVLELIGGGAELYYTREYERIDLENFHPVDDLYFSPPAHSWYIRLQVVSYWIWLLYGEKLTPLAKELIEGVRNLSGGLIKYLESIERKNVGSAHTSANNQEYYSQLSLCLFHKLSTSKLKSDVVLFLDKHNNKENTGRHGVNPMLNKKVRSFLLASLLSHKKRYWKRRRFIKDDSSCREIESSSYAVDCFRDDYSIKLEWKVDGGIAEVNSEQLFATIHDVAWECAMMKGIDFVSFCGNRKYRTLVHKYAHPVLGRGLYQLGVEFHYLMTENVLYYLAEVLLLLDSISKSCSIFQKKLSKQGLPADLIAYFDELKEEYEKKRGDSAKQNNVVKKIKHFINCAYVAVDSLADITLFGVSHKANALQTEDDKQRYLHGILCHYISLKNKSHLFLDTLVSAGIVKKRNLLGYTVKEIAKKDVDQVILLIKEYLEKTWTVDLAQLHSFLQVAREDFLLNDGLSIATRFFSQHESYKKEFSCYHGGTSVELHGITRAYGLVKIATAHMTKVPEELMDGTSRLLEVGSRKSPVPLMGRFDLVKLHDELYPSRTLLSDLGVFGFNAESVKSPSAFPLFIRKETVVPVYLDEIHNSNVIRTAAVMCIQLNRSSWRLLFLLRLAQAYSSENKDSLNYDLSISSHLRKEDRIYLSDGNSDIIIEVRESEGEKRLEDVFALKKYLFNDFLVAKVETFPSTSMLSNIPKNSGYKVTADIRLRQERYLSYGTDDLRTQLIKGISKQDGYDVYSIHGRMDFRLEVDDPEKLEFRKLIGDVLNAPVVKSNDEKFRGNGKIDRIQVTLGQLEVEN